MKKFIAGCILALLLVGNALANVPLGIANNNPGNIVKTGISWKGEVKCKSRFECFDSPESGLRALAINLRSHYQRHKADTPSKLLHRWSPPVENDTRNLVRVFHKRTGIAPHEPIRLEDKGIFGEVMNAIILQENGSNPYGAMIDKVLSGIFVEPKKTTRKDIPSDICKAPLVEKKKKEVKKVERPLAYSPIFFHTRVPDPPPASQELVAIFGDRRRPILNYL